MGKFEDLLNQGRKSSEEEEKEKGFEDLLNQGREARKSEEISKVDDSYINSFFDNTDSFFDTFSKDYESMGWDNASQIYRKNKSVLDSLYSQRDVISGWMDEYRSSLDEEYLKNLTSVLDEFDKNAGSVMKGLTEARDFYDRDKNQDAYLAYVDYQDKLSYDLEAGQKKIQELEKAIDLQDDIEQDQSILDNWISHWEDQEIPEDVRAEMNLFQNQIDKDRHPIDELRSTYGLSEDDDLELILGNEKNYFASAKKVHEAEKIAQYIQDVKSRPDFAENSKYKSTANGKERSYALTGHLKETGFDDLEYDYINKNPDAIAARGNNDVANNTAVLGLDSVEQQEMNEDEIAVYNYLYATEGRDAAKKFVTTITSDLNYRERKRREEEARARAQEHPFKESIGTVLTSPMKTISYIGQLADYLADGEIDQNAGYNKYSYESTAVRSAVSEIIEASGKWGNVGSFLYNTGMSMGDFLVSTGVSGGNGAIALTIMGSGAAADRVISAKDRGLSDGQAFALGTIAGIAEALTERVSLEALMNPNALADGAWKYILKNMLAEGSEETASSIINLFADVLISKDQSEWNQSILKLMNDGKTREEAFGIVFAEQAKSIGLDALGGMLSGGVMGGGGAAVNSVSNIGVKTKYGSQQDALVTELLDVDPNNAFAHRMKSRLGAGKNLSGSQLRHLIDLKDTARYTQYKNSTKKAVKDSLTEYGETGDVNAISEALTKKIMGEELTRSEKRLIAKSEYAQSISQELDAAVESAQSEDVATEGITPEEYTGIVKDAEAVVNEADETESTAKVEDLKSEIASLQETVRNPDISAEEKAVATEQLEAAQQELKTLESSEEAQSAPKKVKVTAKVATAPVTIEEASKKYGAQAKAMVATYNQGQNVRMFDSAYSVAYEMGKVGPEMMEYALKSEATQYLTPEQREHAFNAGLAARQTRTDSLDRNAKASGKKVRREGTVKVEGNPSEFREALKDLKDPRRDAIKTLMTIAKVTGINIVLTKSKVDANGRLVGDQGAFKWSNDTIYIDINAGVDYARDTGELTKYTMLRTFSHEFTHFLEKYAPKEYSALQDLVFAEMKAKLEGTKQTIDDLIVDKQNEYKDISYEEASREVIAESMTDMLRDASFIEKLTQKHQSLAQKLLTKLKEFLADIKSYFAQLADNPSTEAKLIQQEVDGAMKYLESIIEAFDKAAVAAVENYQGMTEDVVSELTPGQEGVVVAEDGEPVAYSTEDGTVMLSIRTYEEEGRSAFRTYLEKCVKNKSLTEAEMTEMMDGIEDIYNTCKEFKNKYAPFSAWSDAEVIRDTRGKPVFSVVTPNGEYKMNLDFSLVCKKRRALDAVFNEMSKRGIIDDFELGPKTIVKINELIRKHGFETACALCFVDAKRFRQADVADSVVRLYNELVQSLVPEEHSRSIDYFNFAGYGNITAGENGIHTWPNSKLDFSHINEVLKKYEKGTVEAKAARYIKNNPEARRLLLRGDFMSSAGFDAVKSQNQNIMKIYNSKKGTGGPKAAFGDVQYMNEIISKNKSWTPEKAYDVGGVRIQSFSDYVPRMVFDYVQMIYDLAAKKLPAHAYTKEALFVKQFGLTGIKINMSLIPAIVDGGIAPGLDANGEYAWAGESFDFDTAKEIQKANGYSENCGTIAVGVSYEHIMKLLGDPEIRMVIPYHKSSLNPIVAHMNRIGKYTDYTKAGKTPVEHGGQRTTNKDGKTIEHEFNFAKTLHEVGDPKAVADQYLAWCDKNGYTPKFDEFKGHENYYKLLTDFTVYDASGNYVAQREVKAVFPKEGNEFGAMRDLIEEGLEEDAIIEGRRKSKMSEMVDEIERSIPRTEAEISDDEQVEQADHDLEAELMDENQVQRQARDYSDDSNEKGQKNNTKTSAASPLSRGLAKQESFSMASKPVTAAAKNLGITENISQFSDVVKQAVSLFSDVADAIDNNAPVRGAKKAISANSLAGTLVANGVMARQGSGDSVYLTIGNHTLRISDHSAHAENFDTSDENLSISLLNDGRTNEFKADDSSKVIEAKFRKKYLNEHPQVFRKVVEDIARFVVTGEYHDTAGALDYDFSGGIDYKISAILRLYDDAVARNDEFMADKLADRALEMAEESPTDVQYQKRTNTLTDHEILDMAAKELDTAKLTDGEKAALEIFRKKNDALKALKDERQKQGSLYYQYQFGDQKDTAKATAARNRMTVLDGKITKASAEVLGIEDKKILKDVLRKSRNVIEQHERKASIERVKTAREEARVKERKIANEKLEALRQKKNERIAEVRAEERQKAQEKMDTLRNEKNKKIEDVKTEAREKAKAKEESRKKTELRTKIQKQLGELNSLLTNGNKKKNVKNGMKDTASALLAYGELLFSEDANLTPEALVRNGIETDLTEAESKLLNEYNDLLEKRDLYLGQINEAASGTDANKDARIEGLQKMVDIINQKKLPALIKKLDGVFERERARLNKVTFSAVLKDLTDSYKALEKSKDPFISGAYNQYVYDRLVAMNNPDAGVATTIKDLSLTQLAELNDAIKMVVTSIKNANTLFRDGQREVLSEIAEQVFMEIRKLYRKGGDPAAFKNAVTDKIKSFAWNELKPIYAFERIGSEKFTELFWDVINGESEYGLECEKAADFVREIRGTYGYKKWDLDSVKVFKTADGQDFKLTLGDMMSIYAYSRRDQAHKHMFEGGFTFHTGKTETYKDTDGKKRVRMVEEDTYRMTPELLDEILSSLSKEQKAYAEAMQDYLTKLGEMGNKVSRVLYGIDLFKETHYFPLKSDRDYRSTVETQLNQTQTAASLVNIGMAKETVPEASNPIVLQQFDDVAIQHIDQMLKYSSMVLPIENLRKVMDFAPGEYGTWNAPVKKLISTVHGAAASQYMNQWLTDLNGSSGLDGAKNPLASLFARSKKVAVAGNLSVVVQQYFAIARAMSEIDGKYFVSSDGKTDANQWEELKKWAGVAVIKDMGGFDVGSARSATEFIGEAGAKTGIMTKIDKATSYGAAKMDQVGWSKIWKAVKAEIADTTDLKVGTEEFFKAAAKRFTEAVVRTQVYDSVTSRSGFMRSKHESVKYLVSFMGEPTTTFNMMLNAQMKLVRAHRNGNKTDVKKARNYMLRTSGAVILSTVLGIVAKSAVYGMRDDDETKSFMERWVKKFGEYIHQEMNPLELLPVFRDLVSIIKGQDVERPDLDLISSTINAVRKAVEKDDGKLEAWGNVVLSVFNLAGLPLKNVWRDGRGVVRLIGDITDDIGPKDLGKTFFKEGFLGKEATKVENLYAAIVSEDTAVLDKLKEGYDSDSDYTNAVRKALRECDDRIHAAAQARYEGDTMTYMDLAKEIIAEGNFIQDDVVAAIMSEVTAIENEASGEKESTPRTYSMYNAADYLSVADRPKESKEIKDYLIAGYIEDGKTNAEAEREFLSDLKNQIKTWYTDEESEVRISKQEATEMLRKYVGMKADEVTSTINQWSSKVVTGIAYDDIKDEFMSGKITASRAIDMRVRYGGETTEEAREKVEDWNFEKKYGFSYSNRKDAYINGEVSATTLRQAMISHKGMTAEDADNEIRALDLLKRNPNSGLDLTAAKAMTKKLDVINKSLDECGIKPDVYKKYKDLCKTAGSKKEDILGVIHSLPLSVAQKDALYYLNGWSEKTINEAPWH